MFIYKINLFFEINISLNSINLGISDLVFINDFISFNTLVISLTNILTTATKSSLLNLSYFFLIFSFKSIYQI